jgi:HEXXH motif-containing protein
MTIGYHRLPAGLFEAIAAGGGGLAAAQTLSRAQHSKHALLLLGVVITAEASGQGALARRGYDLLAAAQGHDPGAAGSVIRHPPVGAWAHRTVVALRGGPQLPGAVPGGLAGVAAAAAIRAGVPAEIEVPVHDGLVMLPSVGAAGPVDGEVATVRCAGGRAEVTAAGRRILIPDRYRDRAAGWRPLRALRAGSLELLVDDVDPFRMPAAPSLATGIDPDPWADVFAAAWALLERDHPALAREVAEIVTVIVPLARPPHGLVSSSSPETFGAIALSEPTDACTLASTLAHEVQHVKLSALLDLVQLTRPDDGRRFYAPWREDPRPVSGLLQGAYAYVGVSGFWRRQRELSDRLEPQVEFVRWREAAALVSDVLEASGRLTPAGAEFVRGMSATLRAWRAEPVPDLARQRASEESRRHMARWETRNGPIPV